MDYKLVEVKDIPSVITETPIEDKVQLFKVFGEMEKICDDNNGIGLSAVQIGIPWKAFIIKGDGTGSIPKGKYWHFVDCEYSPVGFGLVKSLEGCLSLKDEKGDLLRYEITRFAIISVRGKRLVNQREAGLTFMPFDSTISAYEQGIVYQHEIDHHRGILISDKPGNRRVEIW